MPPFHRISDVTEYYQNHISDNYVFFCCFKWLKSALFRVRIVEEYLPNKKIGFFSILLIFNHGMSSVSTSLNLDTLVKVCVYDVNFS